MPVGLTAGSVIWKNHILHEYVDVSKGVGSLFMLLILVKGQSVSRQGVNPVKMSSTVFHG